MSKSLVCILMPYFLLMTKSIAIAAPLDFNFFQKETLVAKHTAIIETPPSKITTGSVLWLKSKLNLAKTDKISARIFTLLPDEDEPGFINYHSDRSCKAYISKLIPLVRDQRDNTRLKVASINEKWIFPTIAHDSLYGRYLIVLEKSNNQQSLIRLKTEEDGTNKNYFSSGFIIDVEPDASINMKIIEEIDSKRPTINNLVAMPENKDSPCYKATYTADANQDENYSSIKLTECIVDSEFEYQVN
ncbi:hypothetical protein [Methylophilus aquaticus]|uniref:Uncharacterized protein n=1 Tax=Methylophilus aquaticus TaxID=1971610 RepID=A0ABT9JTT4_9PROT|nr:hypothetical protein [Methylophilus aquaticus]MDP8567967.1 hypothetical protein [Methylophilus aquaticus]